MAAFLVAWTLLPFCGNRTVDHLQFDSISASSTYAGLVRPWQSPPEFLLDQNLRSAWCEGAEGYGQNVTISLQLKQPLRFNLMLLINGLSRDPTALRENAQVHELQIRAALSPEKTDAVLQNTEPSLVRLKPGSFAAAEAKEPLWQVVRLDKELVGDRIQLQISSAHAEKTRYEDTCLSEIEFGYEAEGRRTFFPLQNLTDLQASIDDKKKARQHDKALEALLYLTKNQDGLDFYKSAAHRNAPQIYKLWKGGRVAWTSLPASSDGGPFEYSQNGRYTLNGKVGAGILLEVQYTYNAGSGKAAHGQSIAMNQEIRESWTVSLNEAGSPVLPQIQQALGEKMMSHFPLSEYFIIAINRKGLIFPDGQTFYAFVSKDYED